MQVILELDDELEYQKLIEFTSQNKIRVIQKNPNKVVEEKLRLLMKGKGTINKPWTLSEVDLQRENLY